MTKEYMIFFRGTRWEDQLSPQQLQDSMKRFTEWFEDLSVKGTMKGAQPLQPETKLVTKQGVADGPFAESKEAVGGYVLVAVETMDQAVAIARTWPGLDYGGSIEVRPVAAECPLQTRARELEHAATGA